MVREMHFNYNSIILYLVVLKFKRWNKPREILLKICPCDFWDAREILYVKRNTTKSLETYCTVPAGLLSDSWPPLVSGARWPDRMRDGVLLKALKVSCPDLLLTDVDLSQWWIMLQPYSLDLFCFTESICSLHWKTTQWVYDSRTRLEQN